MRYSAREMLSNDIDWFFSTSDGFAVHVASAGGFLPKFVEKERNRKIREKLLSQIHGFYISLNESKFYQESHIRLNLLDKIEINENALSRIWDHQRNFFDEENPDHTHDWQEDYLLSFCVMANCGFISFDRMYVEDNTLNFYQWIADGSQNILKGDVREELPKIQVSLNELKNENTDWIELLNMRNPA